MELRPASPSDAGPVARLHVRSWQTAYRGLLPDAYLDGLDPTERARRYTFGHPDPKRPYTVVAAEGDEIFGFVTTMPSRDPDAGGAGELCALYVAPDRWGAKIGSALLAAGRARLVELGHEDALLWVLVGNARAERFYRADGWAADGGRRAVESWGIGVDEIRYRRAL
jgi:GNAT superfamily N-acetyltransferase